MTAAPHFIYMDHAATTPVLPEVADMVRAVTLEHWGNASSVHGFGQQARKLVEEARVKVAALIGARPEEIVFTSGATESNNTVIKGAAEALKAHGERIVITAIEHPCVMEAARTMGKRGWHVTHVKVDGRATVDLDHLRRSLAEKTALVSVMLANNEVGTIEPVAEAARLAKERGAAVHTDATQAVGRIPVDVNALGVDYLSLSAHKFHGPKGVGALFVRRGARLTPLLHGGEQEAGKRSGTLNVPGIAGLGVAAELARRDLDARATAVRALRDRLEAGITARIPHCLLNGHPVERLPNHLNMSFEFVEGEAMLLSLDMHGVVCSTGSACSAGSLDPSHVLVAMGCAPARAHSSLRFSLGLANTAADVDTVIEILAGVVQRLRRMSPTYADFQRKRGMEAAGAGV